MQPPSDTAPSLAPSSAPWPRRRLWIFRTGVALFAIEIALALFDASPATRAAANALFRTARDIGAALAPKLVVNLDAIATRSDAYAVVLGLLGDALLAIAGAALWGALDRRRHYERLAGAVRVALRYLVAVTMLVYGGIKVIPVQFPLPSAEDMLRPLGQRSPMNLLWVFMGTSPAYTVFSGLGECVGGALLFWRRTTTLGALLLAGVLANVAMINYAYDVPVKRGATLLLLASLVLASRDARRLARVLVLDRATAPNPEAQFRASPWAARARLIVKPMIVAAAIAGPITGALVLGSQRNTIVPLQGVYSVERFVREGHEVPPSLVETERWRRIVLGDRGSAVVQTMDDRFARHMLTVDEGAGTLSLAPARGADPLRFHFERAASGDVRLVGQGSTIDEVVLHRLDERALFRVIETKHG